MIRYEELAELLEERFPRLSERFAECAYVRELNHCYYGDILNPYIKELLKSDITNEVAIKKVFGFYEKLASNGDEKTVELLQVTLLEYLWDEKIVYERALMYMQPKTREVNEKISDYLNIPKK